MRKAFVILLILMCSKDLLAQNLLQKPIRLSIKQGSVGELLAAINNTDSVVLSYSSAVISLAKKVQLSGKEISVEDHLRSILIAQPVRFVEQNGKVFLVFDEQSPYKKKITISGFITDQRSGERLIGASLFATNKNLGTTSNNYGFFSLTLDKDSILVLISHAGYFTNEFLLLPAADTTVNITMEQNIVVNQAVVVNAEVKKNSDTRTVTGRINVPASLIKSMPSLLGEADVLKTLQLLPGIQAGNEGSAGLVVRGGGTDQNLVLLDGVPVYNATHAFGLFSIFNADAVHNVDVIKGGFPASYGGRLSSVIDVHLKEGDKYKFHGEGGVGLIFSKLTLEGPIQKGRSSFLVSGRRTYADLIVRPIIRANERQGYDVFAAFSDLNVKTNFYLGPKDHLYAGFYTGIDKFFSEDDYTHEVFDINGYRNIRDKSSSGFSWGNTTAMMRWNHVFNKKTFSNLTLNYSYFRFRAFIDSDTKDDTESFNRISEQRYFSSIRDYNIRYDLDYIPSPNHFIKAGLTATLHRYRPGVNEVFQSDSIVQLDYTVDNQSLFTTETDLYVEDDIRFNDKMKMNVGVRLSGFAVQKKFFASVQPRINWLYRLNNRWSVKASAVKMNQFIHLLTNSNLGLPTDLWVPVTKRIPPQVSYQVAAGITYLPGTNIETSAEIYYKNLRNVIEYAEGSGFTNSYALWENMVEVGRGNTYGAEWVVQKKKGKISGLLSYTLSWSNRRFQNINNGQQFPYKYDRRHEIKTAVVWQPSKKFEWSMDWIFASGNSISLPIAFYYDPATKQQIDVYSGRNDFRLKPYHRMDMAMKFIKQKKRYQRTWVISVYNVYNQPNPFFITKYRGSQNAFVFTQTSLFPIIPSISWQFKF